MPGSGKRAVGPKEERPSAVRAADAGDRRQRAVAGQQWRFERFDESASDCPCRVFGYDVRAHIGYERYERTCRCRPFPPCSGRPPSRRCRSRSGVHALRPRSSEVSTDAGPDTTPLTNDARLRAELPAASGWPGVVLVIPPNAPIRLSVRSAGQQAVPTKDSAEGRESRALREIRGQPAPRCRKSRN